MTELRDLLHHSRSTSRISWYQATDLDKGEELETKQKTVIEIQPDWLRRHRKTIRESQDRFWARFGVTQSRGSRFEQGAVIPPPVAILLELYFNGVVTESDLNRMSKAPYCANRNLDVGDCLRRSDDTQANSFDNSMVTR